MRKELFTSKKMLSVLLGLMAMGVLAMMPLGCGGGSSGSGSTTYTVGGSVTGLTGTVVLQNNAVDDLTVSADGSFTFATALADGAGYDVTVLTQPSGQTCTASASSGTISGANVTNVAVNCANTTYMVGGNVTGLTGTVVLQNNAVDDLTVSADGSFTFATALADGAAYNVQVSQQPSGQTCTASANTGTIAGANVTDVDVTCSSTTYRVGGAVAGLDGTVVLQNNGGDDLTISVNSTFTFATPLADGAGYDVTVLTQPSGQTCISSLNSGTIAGTDVTDVGVNCFYNPSISGTVEDTDSSVLLSGITIEARDAGDDSVIDSTTTAGTVGTGSYSLVVPALQDFYLHANGAAVGGTTYFSQNLQIETEATDRSGIKIYMVPDSDIGIIAGAISVEASTDAMFALDVASVNDTLITGVTVAASPSFPNIWYQSPTGTFSTTGPTADFDAPSVVGYVVAPGANGTYTFTMSGNTTGMTIAIDNPVKLRLIPGEISMPIEP